MFKEKPGRPVAPEVTGVISDLEGVARDFAGAPRGGTVARVIMEDGEHSPCMGKITTRRGTKVNAVFVGREWVRARMEKELAYRMAFYEWLHSTEPKGRAG